MASQFAWEAYRALKPVGIWAYLLEMHVFVNTTSYKYSWKPGSFCMRKSLRYSIK